MSFAAGQFMQALGSYSIAMGSDSTADASFAIALGHDGTTASGHSSVALGWGCIASGKASFADGSGCTATGDSHVAMGHNATTDPSNVFVYSLDDASWAFGFVAGTDSSACLRISHPALSGAAPSVKTFVIPHPEHEGKMLRHACVEAPTRGNQYI